MGRKRHEPKRNYVVGDNLLVAALHVALQPTEHHQKLAAVLQYIAARGIYAPELDRPLLIATTPSTARPTAPAA